MLIKIIISATRSDACEQAAKEAKLRAEKAEEEVTELLKKATQLEVGKQ